MHNVKSKTKLTKKEIIEILDKLPDGILFDLYQNPIFMGEIRENGKWDQGQFIRIYSQDYVGEPIL